MSAPQAPIIPAKRKSKQASNSECPNAHEMREVRGPPLWITGQLFNCAECQREMLETDPNFFRCMKKCPYNLCKSCKEGFSASIGTKRMKITDEL